MGENQAINDMPLSLVRGDTSQFYSAKTTKVSIDKSHHHFNAATKSEADVCPKSEAAGYLLVCHRTEMKKSAIVHHLKAKKPVLLS